MIKSLISKYNEWKFLRTVKKAGYTSVKQYKRQHDPRINRRAYTVTEWYSGYEYYVKVSHPDLYVRSNEIILWCEEYCTGEWRWDWIPISDYNNETEVIDGIFGDSYIFFAFRKTSDYNWFNLKWT